MLQKGAEVCDVSVGWVLLKGGAIWQRYNSIASRSISAGYKVAFSIFDLYGPSLDDLGTGIAENN